MQTTNGKKNVGGMPAKPEVVSSADRERLLKRSYPVCTSGLETKWKRSEVEKPTTFAAGRALGPRRSVPPARPGALGLMLLVHLRRGMPTTGRLPRAVFFS